MAGDDLVTKSSDVELIPIGKRQVVQIPHESSRYDTLWNAALRESRRNILDLFLHDKIGGRGIKLGHCRSEGSKETDLASKPAPGLFSNRSLELTVHDR